MKNRFHLVTAGLAILLGFAMQANANTISFTYTGSSLNPTLAASGSLDLLFISGNEYTITAGTITIAGDTVSGDNGSYAILPGNFFPSPLGAFNADNKFFLPADPSLNNWGALFSASGKEVNLFGNGPGNYSLYVYSNESGYSTSDQGGNFNVPDGGLSIAMLGLAMGGLVVLRRKFGLS